MTSGSPSELLTIVAPAPMNAPGRMSTQPAMWAPGATVTKSPMWLSWLTVAPTLMWTWSPTSDPDREHGARPDDDVSAQLLDAGEVDRGVHDLRPRQPSAGEPRDGLPPGRDSPDGGDALVALLRLDVEDQADVRVGLGGQVLLVVDDETDGEVLAPAGSGVPRGFPALAADAEDVEGPRPLGEAPALGQAPVSTPSVATMASSSSRPMTAMSSGVTAVPVGSTTTRAASRSVLRQQQAGVREEAR